MVFSLVLLNGSAPGATQHLDPAAEVTIGRHGARELTLDDDRASRLHARVSFRAKKWHVEDCGSMNGTFVNSQPIQQTVLESGDLIRIGQSLILFVLNAHERDSSLPTSLLKSTTLLGKSADVDVHSALVEQSLNEPMSQVVRDSAVLCRLANQLHQESQVESLIQIAINALVDGISPDAASFWLVGVDGRLRCAGTWGDASSTENPHVLASLSVEKNKAFLIRDIGEDPEISEAATNLGTALSVPIPNQGGCRGAIECYRFPDRPLFTRGALDFTSVVAHQTGLALENLEHRERLEQANEQLRLQLAGQSRLIGSSPEMQEVLEKITRVGPTAATTLILGESGTGKELVAHSIHELSQHSSGPCVAVNCAAFSDNLLESELFGHEAGAFTGADRRRIGQFERAHRGTIFLDEVGEMSLACQAKLLRMLEGHPFQRVGGEEFIHVDVRTVAATHRDLQELVNRGKFREDLYYRLRVVDIHVPPLRERGDDLIELASLFMERFRKQTGRGPQRLDATAINAIRAYHWPWQCPRVEERD